MSMLDALLLDPLRVSSWIAYRTDGVKGSGTQSDPWDGSTRFAPSISVQSITNIDQAATVTTQLPHGFANNDVVTIDGVTGNGAAQWNGTFLVYGISGPSPRTFNYYMHAVPAAAAGGTMTASKVLGYRFDEIMSGLAQNTNVCLGPTASNRPFLTRGYAEGAASGWQAKYGMRIIGSGIDVTTLRLIGQPVNGTYYPVGHDLAGGSIDYFELSDLTIDANLMIPTSCSAICGAVRVMGNHVRIRRIKAINWGANSPKPVFVISVVTADPPSGVLSFADCGIEDVIAVSPATSDPNALITVVHAGPKDDVPTTSNEAFGTGPFLRNCFVDCGSPILAPEYRGLSMAWCSGGIVEGNQVHNTKYGGPCINYSSCRDLVVRGNFFKNVLKGPFWNLGTLASSYGGGSLVRSGTLATVTVAAGDFLAKGDRVKIAGSPSNFDGIHEVTGTSANTFTFNTSVNAVSSSTLSSVQKVFGVDRLIVESNTVELATQTSGPLVGIHINDNGLTGQDPTYPAYPFRDVIVRDNNIRYVDELFDTTYVGYGIQVNGAKNLLIKNNVVEAAPANPIRNARCGSVKCFNNRSLAGVLTQGWNEDWSRKYDELETDVEDAFVLAYLERH